MAWFCDMFAKICRFTWSWQRDHALPPHRHVCRERCSCVWAHLLAQHISHWSSCTNPVASRLGCPAGRGPVCLCTMLPYCRQKASGSHLAHGHQLWLSQGFTPTGLSQTDPIVALDVSETSNPSSLLLSFQVGHLLLLALVQCVASACSLLVTSCSPPTCDGACLDVRQVLFFQYCMFCWGSYSNISLFSMWKNNTI